MDRTSPQTTPDQHLLRRFYEEVNTKVPHIRGTAGGQVENPTPLLDITRPLVECARVEYGLQVSPRVKVLGKFDSQILGGSVKMRPAVHIVEDAILSGKLKSGTTIFEATSGNFGLALGLFRKLGLEVVVLVSRKLQQGVVKELETEGVRLVNLDVDICPAPGLKVDANLAMAKGIAESLRDQFSQLRLNLAVFDRSRAEIEQLLARQDVINLAKLLARIYSGFCPEQYDNQLNVEVHETITGPEIDQQLGALGDSLGDYRVICTFGTGGTSTGLANYIQKKHGRKSVHVVFPLSNQDVAGIRTREKALGLRFYRPELYAGIHDVDFEAAKRLLRFFVNRGYDIGESSALALLACLQMQNFGVAEKFVVLIADGSQKYLKTIAEKIEEPKRLEVTFEEARSALPEYGQVIWTHTMFVPKETGIKMIANSLGCDEARIKVARAQDVQKLIETNELPQTMKSLLPKDNHKLLLVCMAGATSLRVAELVARMGIDAQSVKGGINDLAQSSNTSLADVVQMAME